MLTLESAMGIAAQAERACRAYQVFVQSAGSALWQYRDGRRESAMPISLRRWMAWALLAGALLRVPLGLAAEANITGTWVARQQSPMGEMEFVFRLKSGAKGGLSGSVTTPFGHSPILGGNVNGNAITLNIETETFGDLQRRTVKGKILGDELQFESAGLMPSAPPGPPGAGGMGGPAFGAGPPPMDLPQALTARRGTPTPTFKAGPVDYKTLPKVELPALRELPGNGLALRPPMGWNTWNRFHTQIDDKTIRGIADAVVASGMREAGYVYINLDDGWEGKRDSRGVLQPNANFPDMKALADYVHSKGLKLGLYSSPGPRTCGGFEGSYGHERIDARTWASWGIDYLKYDWCSASRIWKDEDMRAVYQRMGEALQATGRPMIFSLCQYGRAGVERWGPLSGGNLWRTTNDVFDNWTAMLRNITAQDAVAGSAAPGHWNDPDMLEVGNGGMTATEYRTHFSLWAIAAAPLIAGNDVRALDEETRDILLNKEVIAVNQDPSGRQGRRVVQQGNVEIWLRSLSDGAFALAVVNRGDVEEGVSLKWSDLELPAAMSARDLWQHRDLGQLKEGYQGRVAAHGVLMLRLQPG
jgi:alpha-galactosidase